jgi:hypothetical protein
MAGINYSDVVLYMMKDLGEEWLKHGESIGPTAIPVVSRISQPSTTRLGELFSASR